MDQYANVVAFAKYMGGEIRSLPELPDVESLSPRILRVLGGNPGVVSLISLIPFAHITYILEAYNCCRCHYKEPTPMSLAPEWNAS